MNLEIQIKLKRNRNEDISFSELSSFFLEFTNFIAVTDCFEKKVLKHEINRLSVYINRVDSKRLNESSNYNYVIAPLEYSFPNIIRRHHKDNHLKIKSISMNSPIEFVLECYQYSSLLISALRFLTNNIDENNLGTYLRNNLNVENPELLIRYYNYFKKYINKIDGFINFNNND